jgi:hypothetical protein
MAVGLKQDRASEMNLASVELQGQKLLLPRHRLEFFLTGSAEQEGASRRSFDARPIDCDDKEI